MDIDKLILVNLLTNEDFVRKTLPYIKEEYFSDRIEKNIFTTFSEYFEKYGDMPSPQAINIAVSGKNFSEEDHKTTKEVLDELNSYEPEERMEWLVDETEKFCQEKAIYNALLECIQISDGSSIDKNKNEIPDLMRDALAVSFNSDVGHDYFGDIEARYDFFQNKEMRIPFDMEIFNTITNGGLPPKTLSILMAGTGVGKSLVMCHFAKSFVMSGKNVLYITMEMAEEWISQRIDANLLDTKMGELEYTPKESYVSKLNKLKDKGRGRLIVKEFPTSGASVVHFEHLLNELDIKKNFRPDIIFIDYINICSSKRITKMHSGVNSYTLIKSIAEEIRGLAVEYNVPIMSATQTNREGFNNSDVDLTNTAESFGLPATTDLMLALIVTEELEELGQIMVKQLKNRFAGIPSDLLKFNIGVDKSKMRLYELDGGQTFARPNAGFEVPALGSATVQKSLGVRAEPSKQEIQF